MDELRVDSELVARAARNGIRLGAASAGAWPAIRTILEAADARLRREQMWPQGDSPIIIELASVGFVTRFVEIEESRRSKNDA